MSFSGNVKKELCRVQTHSRCCSSAEGYGLLLFGSACSDTDIRIRTDDRAVAERYARRIGRIVNKELKVIPPGAGGGFYTATLPEGTVGTAKAVLNACGISPDDFEVNPSLIEGDCCFGSFLRGAFLAGGTVTAPDREYHLEWASGWRQMVSAFAAFCREHGLPVRTTVRQGIAVAYLKDSAAIEDVLTLMGATMSALEIMNVKIYKDIRNNTNRITNCDNANIGKTVRASAEQMAAINKLTAAGRTEELSEEQKLICRLRTQYPEASLSELAELSKLGRSKVVRLLGQITQLSNK